MGISGLEVRIGIALSRLPHYEGLDLGGVNGHWIYEQVSSQARHAPVNAHLDLEILPQHNALKGVGPHEYLPSLLYITPM
jgi:hypothetical protein